MKQCQFVLFFLSEHFLKIPFENFKINCLTKIIGGQNYDTSKKK